MIEEIKQRMQAAADVKLKLVQDAELQERLALAVELVCVAFDSGRRVYFCGNGGSAADAQHLAAELTGRFYKNRKALPAEALHCNTSYITALANDFSYDAIYAHLVDGIMQEGDVLLGLSTSGNSPNIVKAFEKAKEKGVKTIGFTGESGGKLKPLSDLLLNVPSLDTPRIQECHILLGHILCELVEAKLF
jgi:D-sedoheptulose 7-phosphate isomerase